MSRLPDEAAKSAAELGADCRKTRDLIFYYASLIEILYGQGCAFTVLSNELFIISVSVTVIF